MIQEATSLHLQEIVQIHQESFPGHFSTTLGKRFLTFFYRKQIDSSDFIFLVDMNEAGNVLGFITGSPCSNTATGKLVRKNLIGLIYRIPVKFIFSKNNLRRGMSLLSGYLKHYSAQKREMKEGDRTDTPPEQREVEIGNKWGHLISIVVSKQARRSGIAKLLIDCLHQRLMTKGVDYVLLGTYEDNIAANRLFQNCGYKFDGKRETNAGKIINQYRWTPPSSRIDT